MSWTKKLIYLTIYWICLDSLINRYLWNSPIITLLPDILVISISLFSPNKKPLSKVIGKTTLIVFTTFFTVGSLSAVINGTPLTCFLWGLRMLIRYPLLFYIMYQHFNITDVSILKKNLYQSFWINAIFICLQFSQGITGDAMGGIWAGNGILAVYILLSIIIYERDYFVGKMSLLNFSFKVIFFFICATWSEIKMLYFIIPITIYITYCFFHKFNISQILIIIIGYFTLIPTIQWGLSFYYDQDYINTLNIESLNDYNNGDYGFSGYSYNRGTCIQLATTQFLKEPLHLLIGHGIGSATISNLFPSEIGTKYGSITYYSYFTSSYALIEVGWGGFILYLLFYLFLFSTFLNTYKRKNNYTEVKGWAAIGCLTALITFIIIYYNSTSYNDYYFAYIIWAMCAISIRDHYILRLQNDNKCTHINKSSSNHIYYLSIK